jgi:hypothetical protein
MASRREQKEQLRKEREQREATAKAGQRRKQLIGYGAGGAIVLVAVIVAVALLAGGGGGSSSASSDVLPDGGNVPEVKDDVEVAAAAKAAGCELKSVPVPEDGRVHLEDLSQTVKYASKPPTSGQHYGVPAEDGAYEDPPDVKELVHTLEHGRIIVWFKKGLSADQRAALKAFYDEDTYQMVLVPDMTGMTYAVAATAWNRDPQPNGTGQLLGCAKFNDDVFTAIESFKDENRSRGPEPVP